MGQTRANGTSLDGHNHLHRQVGPKEFRAIGIYDSMTLSLNLCPLFVDFPRLGKKTVLSLV